MARRIREEKLDTRSARIKLKQRREPYWASMSGGLALGYRKGSTGGTWIAKHYSAEEGRRYQAVGPADDILDADDRNIFNFNQAQVRARNWLATPSEAEAGPYRVAQAMDDYLHFLESDGRPTHTIRDARYRDSAFIRPKLGSERIANLTSDKLRRWRDDLVRAAPRLRTRRGEAQKHRVVTNDDARRARRASANRTWTVLRAALNRAFSEGKALSDLAWRKVKPYKGVEVARGRYLSIAEAKRLINACDPEFRSLVQAALQTSARYGELARLIVADFNADVGTINIRQSKSGKPRHVVLTDEGQEFFRQLTVGRAGDDVMLRKADGSTWGMSHQLRPMAGAITRAKITPEISFHGLRHTWASLSVMSGVPLMVVARNLGHVDTRMVEKHYGHLAPSYIADAIRAGAPKFGLKTSKRVAALTG
jgi:integrase